VIGTWSEVPVQFDATGCRSRSLTKPGTLDSAVFGLYAEARVHSFVSQSRKCFSRRQ
jgi:hypothetical protein